MEHVDQPGPKEWAGTSSHLVVYEAPDGTVQIDVRLEDDTMWLTQADMMAIFGASKATISYHVSNIIAEGELSEPATVREIRTVRSEGSRQVTRNITHYNLDMVISVGYRVTSFKATQFRIWATQVLKEYLIKGFVMNDARLKEPQAAPYFDELLERIRDIRASEKMFYHKVRDVFAQTSHDYNPQSSQAREFFQTIQNKLLYAVTGHTAAELVVARADATHPTMGLTSFAGKVVRKKDITTAKNYLAEKELSDLSLLVTMFLDYAENQTRRRKTISMSEWLEKTADFLKFNEYPAIEGSGKTSHKSMQTRVERTYAEYDSARKTVEKEQSETQAANEFAELVQHATQLETQRPKPSPAETTNISKDQANPVDQQHQPSQAPTPSPEGDTP